MLSEENLRYFKRFNIFNFIYFNNIKNNERYRDIDFFCICCVNLGRFLKKDCEHMNIHETTLEKCSELTLKEFKKLYEKGEGFFWYTTCEICWTPGDNIQVIKNYYSTTIPFDEAYKNRNCLRFYYFTEKD